MPHEGRGDEDVGTWWELYDPSNVEQHKVASCGMIVLAHGSYVTPPSSFIHHIEVVIADRLRAKVDREGRENAIIKIPSQTGVIGVKAAKLFNVFLVKFWRIICERACNVKWVG
jgi:hypothetical protein